jgi:catechol 2,3-dioxygenase-like lactoylglutathione lyase family enzyme
VGVSCRKEEAMRILTNICSNDLQKSKDFYVELLDFKVKYDSDWYVQLCSPDDSEIEYGIIQRNHDLVPKEYQNAPTGMYVTFVVDDVDMVYERALKMKVTIVETPRNEFYGQRRFLAKDPNGCLIDICSPWEAE